MTPALGSVRGMATEEADNHATALDRARALADPLRLVLLHAITVDGPLTTAELKTRFPESRGALNFDLKDLAQCGHITQVESDPPTWAAQPGSMNWDDAMLRDPETAAAVAELDRVVIQTRINRTRDWMNHRKAWGPEWGDVSLSADWLARMTPTELDAMRVELEQVARKHRRSAMQARENDPNPEETRPVFVFLMGFPCRLGEVEEPG